MEKGLVKTFKQQYLEMLICAMIPLLYHYKKEFAQEFNISDNDSNERRLLKSTQETMAKL